MTDTPQPGDAAKAAAFAQAVQTCRQCKGPMEGKHRQCLNPKCLWYGTTLADQTAIERDPKQEVDEVPK